MPLVDRSVLRKIVKDHRKEGSVPLRVIEDLIRVYPRKIESADGMYVVRIYDGSDHLWVDVCKPCSWEEALELWNKRTENGMEWTSFDDFDYYAIYPANTRMLYSE